MVCIVRNDATIFFVLSCARWSGKALVFLAHIGVARSVFLLHTMNAAISQFPLAHVEWQDMVCIVRDDAAIFLVLACACWSGKALVYLAHIE